MRTILTHAQQLSYLLWLLRLNGSRPCHRRCFHQWYSLNSIEHSWRRCEIQGYQKIARALV